MSQISLIQLDHSNIALPHQCIQKIEPWTDANLDLNIQSPFHNYHFIQKKDEICPVVSINKTLRPSSEYSEKTAFAIFFKNHKIGISCNAITNFHYENATHLPDFMKSEDSCINLLVIENNNLIFILNELMFMKRLERHFLESDDTSVNILTPTNGETLRCNEMPGI